MKRKFNVGDRVRVLDGSKINRYFGSWVPDMEKYVGNVFEIRNVCHADAFGMTGYLLHDTSFEFDERWLELVEDEITIKRHGAKTVAKYGSKVGVAKCSSEDTYDFETGAKLAFERLFAPNYKEAKRTAKAGELVKIINADVVPLNEDGTPSYKNGDILKIIGTEITKRARFREGKDKNGRNYLLNEYEYVVLEGYEPPKEEKKEEEKPLLNTKVVFGNGYDCIIAGKIYEIKNGKINTDDGNFPLYSTFHTIEDVKQYFTSISEKDSNGPHFSYRTLNFIEIKED